MGSGYYTYDEMAAIVEELQRRVAELETENGGLRQQLADLHRGVGVSVNILGRALPVAAEHHAASPAAAPARPPEAAAWEGYHHAAQRAPLPAPRTPQPHADGPFPENAWLTGKGAAARQRREERPAERVVEQRPALHPSERITPQWLREGSARTPAAAPAPAASPFVSRAPDAQTWAESYPGRRGGAPERSVAHGQPRSLADWAGQPRAARPPEPQPREPGTRNPYTDSFVLD